jgi:cytochrome P450
MSVAADIYYDPWDTALNENPYPMFRRMRDEAPLYYNEEHDFYAFTRFADVESGLRENDTFISGRGAVLEIIKANIELPPGTLIFEDPPTHTIHRRLLSRVFTPRRVAELEPKIRDFCAAALDPIVEAGADGFDFIADLGAQMPMRVIGMLIGIPEADQQAVRENVDKRLRIKPGEKMKVRENQSFVEESFRDYIEWREKNPSDDIMTDLLNVEFEDETGTTRKLTRQELLTYISVVSGAGNETTTRLIGWTGKLLAEHPDQRRALVEDRSLIPNAIEEILRYETVPMYVGRYVNRDVEVHDQKLPEGSAILMLLGAANRDERRFDDPDRFDIRREASSHVVFGFGAHFCLGAALARLEGRIALDEVLNRFPEWDVDYDNIAFSPTATVRGWQQWPVTVGGKS